MKIKQFIITRFMSNPGLGLGKKIFDVDVLKEAAKYLNNNLIKTLENQTDTDFELIITINEKHNESVIRSLIKDTFLRFNIVKCNNLNNYIRNNIDKSYDYLITTRIDYDDLISSTAVEQCKKIFIEFFNSNIKKEFCITGYSRGLILKNNVLYKTERVYDTGGFFSVFVSLCYNLKYFDDLNKIINIYSLGSHTHLYDGICKIFKHFNLDKITNHSTEYLETYIVRTECSDYNYVWVRHENSGSELLGIKTNQKTIQIDCFDKDTFKKMFGYELLNTRM